MKGWPGHAFSRPERLADAAAGMWLLPAAVRPRVGLLRLFCAHADAIAADAARPASERLARLDSLDAALRATPDAVGHDDAIVMAGRLRDALTAAGVSTEHPRHLVQACKKQVMEPRCRGWSDLLLSCRFGAAPLGRCLLELHGEDPSGAAEVLCCALEILARLRRCKTDYLQRRRIDIPGDWLRQAGAAEADLGADHLSPALRAAVDRMLDRVAELLRSARPLPGQVRHRGLRMEAAIALRRAEFWTERLRRQDPLRANITMSPLRNTLLVGRGLVEGLRYREPRKGN